MGKYTIRLDASQNLHHHLSLRKIFLHAITNGYCWFSRHLSRKMSKLMESLEYVQAYLDDLLCIFRSSLEDYLDKLEEVLRRLCNAGLKVNAEKSTFCALK
jgi:hypothetical protein